jgi:L-lysine exporter family protein LysE/ArgO
MFDLSSLLQGFLLGIGVFLCPGPKDILILREALAGRHAAVLIGIGVGSDAALIALGMLGLSAALDQAPGLQAAALWLGIVLLLVHGLKAARSACHPGDTDKPGTGPAPSGLRSLLVISLLNPAAWMDTVLIIGTVGASLGPGARPGFAGGAVAASLLWFIAIVAGAGHARRFMVSARTWRLLDAGVALAMLGMASYLAWAQWQATGS